MFGESLTEYVGSKLTCWRVVKFMADFDGKISKNIKDTWDWYEIGYNEEYDNLYVAFENSVCYSEKSGFVYEDHDQEDFTEYKFDNIIHMQKFIEMKEILERQVEGANVKLKDHITDEKRNNILFELSKV